jgi:enoyl-CoA hydratase
MDYHEIRLELEPPLARLILRGREANNRVSMRMLSELADGAARLHDDDTVRCLILTAEGADFCAGWAGDTFAEGVDLGPDPFTPLTSLPQPVVCATRGAAVSAGLELALTADVRICAADATFALPETAHGLLPRAGGTQRLARATGAGTALAMVLAGEHLDAAGALARGLVSKVVPPAELEAATMAIANAIAARGPIATRYAKEAVRRGADLTLEQALRYETDLTIILQTTEDRAEGVRAFVEKRKNPDFKGR